MLVEIGDLVKVHKKYEGCCLMAEDGLYDSRQEMTKQKFFLVLEVKSYVGKCKLFSNEGGVGWAYYELIEKVV